MEPTVSDVPVEETETETEEPTVSTVPPEEPEKSPEPSEIGDRDIPLAEMEGSGSPAWALLNLILTILTAIISLALLISYFTGKEKEDETEKRVQNNGEADENENDVKRHGLMRILSILPAIFAVITFILTENMRNPMIFIDRWTILMLLYAVINIMLAVFAIREREEREDMREV